MRAAASVRRRRAPWLLLPSRPARRSASGSCPSMARCGPLADRRAGRLGRRRHGALRRRPEAAARIEGGDAFPGERGRLGYSQVQIGFHSLLQNAQRREPQLQVDPAAARERAMLHEAVPHLEHLPDWQRKSRMRKQRHVQPEAGDMEIEEARARFGQPARRASAAQARARQGGGASPPRAARPSPCRRAPKASSGTRRAARGRHDSRFSRFKR